MTRRQERISSQLREELARLLREDVTDPRIGLVTLTRVDVAPDLSNALVYYSVMGPAAEDPDAISALDDGLHSAAPFLRRRAAGRLPLRRMPELRFRYDPSLALGDRTLALLRQVDVEPADEQVAANGGGDDGETA